MVARVDRHPIVEPSSQWFGSGFGQNGSTSKRGAGPSAGRGSRTVVAAWAAAAREQRQVHAEKRDRLPICKVPRPSVTVFRSSDNSSEARKRTDRTVSSSTMCVVRAPRDPRRCRASRGPERRQRANLRAAGRDERLQVLVRAPLEAMQDIDVPRSARRYLDLARVDPRCATPRRCGSWTTIEIIRGRVRLGRSRSSLCACAIPTDRSFATSSTALAHVRGAALPERTQLVWQQALIDMVLEAPIESTSAPFAITRGSGGSDRRSTRCCTSSRRRGVRVFESTATRGSCGSIRAGTRRRALRRDGLRAHPRRRRPSAVPAAADHPVPQAAHADPDRHRVHGRALDHADRIRLQALAAGALVPAADRDADRDDDLLHGAREHRGSRTSTRAGLSPLRSASFMGSGFRSCWSTRCSSQARIS